MPQKPAGISSGSVGHLDHVQAFMVIFYCSNFQSLEFNTSKYYVRVCQKDTKMITMLMEFPLLKMPLRQGHQNRNRNHLVEFFPSLPQLPLQL